MDLDFAPNPQALIKDVSLHPTFNRLPDRGRSQCDTQALSAVRNFVRLLILRFSVP